MSLQHDFAVVINNDITLISDITLNGEPLSLSGYTTKLYLKATRTTPDASAVQFTPTVVNSEEGIVSTFIARTNFATSGTQWYRIDVTDGSGHISSAIFGTITVLSA